MDLNQHKKEFDKAVEHFKSEIATIRTGRATPSLVEEIAVEHYGGKYQIKELATITVPEPRAILIQPWDKGAIAAIEKAIRASNIGLNPVTDNQGVRLNFPPLSEERRRELVKILGQKTEEARIAVRKIRGEIWDNIQKQEKEGLIREGDKFRAKDDLQKMVDEYNKKIEEMEKKKTGELMA